MGGQVMVSVLERGRKSKSNGKPIGEPAWDIALFYPRQGAWTEQDYLALERNNGKWMIELSDGRLEILPMPNMIHQDMVLFLFTLLREFVTTHNMGRVYV